MNHRGVVIAADGLSKAMAGWRLYAAASRAAGDAAVDSVECVPLRGAESRATK